MSPSKILAIVSWSWLVASASACHDRSSAHGSDSAPAAAPPIKDDAAAVLATASPCDPAAAPIAAGAAIAPLSSIAAWLHGAELPGEPTQPRPAVDDALRARGAQQFAAHCTACHGEHGDGQGPSAANLSDAPANFTTGVYELRSTASKSLPTDLDLFATISRGVHGSAMIPWVTLPEADRWALVAYLETLSVDFSEDQAPPPEPVAAPPPESAALSAHGKELFDGRGCPSCHGPAGKGDGAAAPALRDAAGRPVKPRDLTGPFYHRGSETADIYRTLRTGLDGTPMASFAPLLTVDDTWAIATYVHGLAPAHRLGPGGLECLTTVGSPDPEELAGVRIAMHGMTAP